MSFCQRLAKANCSVDWFIILSAQLIKLLPNLWWKISFKWIIYIVYAEIITKAFFRFFVLKLLSHWHIFLITLRIPYSISDLLDSYINGVFSSVQFISVTQSCPTLCDPMNLSTPGLPVHHQLPEFTQTHIHRVSDAIQPSHPLSSPSPPAPNPTQHQSLFQWVNSSHEVAKVLEFQL